jgi:hypothetical protein
MEFSLSNEGNCLGAVSWIVNPSEFKDLTGDCGLFILDPSTTGGAVSDVVA